MTNGNAKRSFIDDLRQSVVGRGWSMFGQKSWSLFGQKSTSPASLVDLAEALLSRRGEASGVLLAEALLKGYSSATSGERLSFLLALTSQFGPDMREVDKAIRAAKENPEADEIHALHLACEPRRQELFRRLNLAAGGTAALVRMREEIAALARNQPELRQVDADFHHLFSSWFNRGFLTVRRIDWSTSASILEKIIRYEAVHAIEDWDDLRNRLQPEDRRCYGFFHPQLADEPLIFVEVALTRDSPAAIGPLLHLSRDTISAADARTAVFYSISNTQKGLAGISFGNFLIKQVVEILKRDLPDIKTFVTLSPIPGFASWLAREMAGENSALLKVESRAALAWLDEPGWRDDPEICRQLEEHLVPLAAAYLLTGKTNKGQPLDPVARFHLSNGARLERINFLGDPSPNGLRQSHALMVNYQYALGEIEKNHEALVEGGVVASSAAVRESLRLISATRGAAE